MSFNEALKIRVISFKKQMTLQIGVLISPIYFKSMVKIMRTHLLIMSLLLLAHTHIDTLISHQIPRSKKIRDFGKRGFSSFKIRELGFIVWVLE